MARKNDVELVISAKNETDKTFAQVQESLTEITAALAKKPGGVGGFFDGIEKKLEGIVNNKKKVDAALNDTAAIQKAINKQKEFVEAIDAQGKSVTKAEVRLADLRAEFVNIEKAANAARTPNEKLTKSLDSLTTKQSSLGSSIATTRQELEKANAALSANGGLDDKATAAIAKQESKLLSTGKAWREITKEVGLANKALADIAARRDSNDALRKEGEVRVASLKAQLAAAKELNKEFQKQARKEGAGEATKSLARSASAAVNGLTAEYTSARQAQAELMRQTSALNAEYSRQEKLVESNKTKAASQKKIYDDLKSSIAGFIDAQKNDGTARQQASIDKLNASLKSLQDQYSATTSKIDAVNQSIAKSSGVDPKAVAQRDAYRVKIQEAIQAVEQEKKTLAELKAKMDAAGLSTAALSARQKELDIATERLTKDQAQLSDQLNKIDSSAKRAGSSLGGISKTFLGIGEDTRKSLGYIQRIRGELLSIAATATGLYAVGGAIKSIYDTSVLTSKAESRLSVYFKGDKDAINNELKYVRKLADDLKINFETALDEYSKFAAGVDKNQLPLDQLRKTFKGLAIGARVSRQSTDDFSGTMRALSQIFSKGKITAEDFRGQIADRMPGAMQRLASAMKLTDDASGTAVEKLSKMMEKGDLNAKGMVLFAEEIRKQFGPELAAALGAPDAAMAEFQNTIHDLRDEIGKSGFIEELTKGLRELSAELRKPEVKNGLVDIAHGLTGIIKGGVWIIEHFDQIGPIIATVFGAKVIGSIAKVGLEIRASIVAMEAWGQASLAAGSTIGGAIGKIATAFRMLLNPATLASGAAGFAIGTWLYEQSSLVQKAATGIVGYLDLIGRAFSIFGKVVTGKLSLKEAKEQLLKDLDDVSKNVANSVAIIDAEFKAGNKPKLINPEVEKKAAKDTAKDIADSTITVADAISGAGKKLTDNQIESLRNSISDALTQIDKEIQEKSADTLKQRLDAINLEYDKLIDKISKAKANGLTGIDYKGAQVAINQVVAIKQVQEVEKEVNRLIEERRTNVAAINELSADGAITIEEATKRINAENARVLPQMNEALATARQIAGTIKSKPIDQAVGNLESKAVLDQQRASKEQIVALEQRLNAEMELRREKIQTINALVQSGAIGEINGKEQIVALNEQAKVQTADLMAQIEQMILANKELSDSFFGKEMLERIKQAKIEMDSVKVEIVNAADLNQSFASGFTGAFQSFISGAQSAKEAFGAFISDFLIKIAEAILQAAILNAITGGVGGGGGLGGAIAGGVNSMFHHTGGVVGTDGKPGRVPLTAFASAVKYHSGGIAGLKPNEVPAVLQKGEEVLTRNDPRHVMNGGGNNNPMQVKIVNAIDSNSVLKEALNSATGQKVLMNAIRANKSSVKSVLA